LGQYILEIENKITGMIFTFRNQKIMIDRDLATLYGIKTFRLNEQVKRNLSRFEGFIFQLNNEEKNELIANCDRFKTLKHSSSNPYAFNEYGILMLSSVLNSELAIEINRKIIKVFVDLRNQVIANPEYGLLLEQIRRIEAEQESLKMTQRVDNKLLSDQMTRLSSEVRQMSKILDQFQNTSIIIKRPEDNQTNTSTN